MCTAIMYKAGGGYFGRNLDLEYSYNEQVVIVPRKFEFDFTNGQKVYEHLAIIGMAHVNEGYPLFYDGVNECGLAMAGLNFPKNAYYGERADGKTNISPYELIAYILSSCKSVNEARRMLENANLVNIMFSDNLPLSPLHWIVSDFETSITVESVKDGLKIYENSVGVLTNNPTFDMQMFNLNNYMHLSTGDRENTFLEGLDFYSRGMGAMGLPGDWSSQSRFVKAVFVNENSAKFDNEEACVNQFFHMLSSVEMPKGCVEFNGKDEITQYSSCCNLKTGMYYYKTYKNSQINAISLHNENLEGEMLCAYDLIDETIFNVQNKK